MASAGRFFEAVLDGNSQLQKSQVFRVYSDAGATTLATVYTDKTKGTTTTQPLNTSSDGMAEFFVIPGTYYLKIATGTPKKVDVFEDIADTADTETLTAHTSATTSVHGITNTAALETTTGAQDKSNTAEENAKDYADTLLVDATLIGTDIWLISNVNSVIYPSITRDEFDAVTEALVVWPDGTEGEFTADTLSEDFPGAVDAYHVTYEGDTTKTVTQPEVTRNENGAVTAQPELVVS